MANICFFCWEFHISNVKRVYFARTPVNFRHDRYEDTVEAWYYLLFALKRIQCRLVTRTGLTGAPSHPLTVSVPRIVAIYRPTTRQHNPHRQLLLPLLYSSQPRVTAWGLVTFLRDGFPVRSIIVSITAETSQTHSLSMVFRCIFRYFFDSFDRLYSSEPRVTVWGLVTLFKTIIGSF